MSQYPYIDPGLIDNSRTQSWSDLNGPRQQKTLGEDRDYSDWGLDAQDTLRSLASLLAPNLMEGHRPLFESALLDAGGWLQPPERGAMAAKAALSPLVAGIGPLFRESKVAEQIVRNLNRAGASRGATRMFAERLADVPEQYSKAPAVGMLRDYYDALGILKHPEKQSKFGVEIEGGSRVDRSQVLPDFIGNRPFYTDTDSTVRSVKGYPHPIELTYPPIEGYKGASQFYRDLASLNQDVGGKPLLASGPEFGAGAHTSISNSQLDPNAVSKFLERFIEQEPFVYPLQSPGSKREVGRYAQPMWKWALDLPERSYQAYSNPRMLTEQGVWSPDRYYSLNLKNLRDNSPLSRLELRYPHGTVDPNEWGKQMLYAESVMQDALQNKSTLNLPKNYDDFLNWIEESYLKNAPQFEGIRTGAQGDVFDKSVVKPGFMKDMRKALGWKPESRANLPPDYETLRSNYAPTLSDRAIATKTTFLRDLPSHELSRLMEYADASPGLIYSELQRLPSISRFRDYGQPLRLSLTEQDALAEALGDLSVPTLSLDDFQR